MAKPQPRGLIDEERPTVSISSGINREEQGVRARLVLELIANGTVPAQPEHFVQELTKLAAGSLPKRQPSLEVLLKALQQQFHEHERSNKTGLQDHSAMPCDQTLEKIPLETASIAGVNQRSDAIETGVKNFEDLHEQHPAVICQQLQELSSEDTDQRLKNLPGQTARQVAFLLWQDT